MKGAKQHLKRAYPGEGTLTIDGTDYTHTVIRITTGSGGTYALDMAGAQYGWHEAIIPWELYSASRIREIKGVVPFGETRVFCKKRAKDMGERQEWIHSIKGCFAQHVDGAVAWWQRDNISSNELLRLPEDEFQKRKASLLGCISEFMQRYKSFQESKDGFVCQVGPKYGVFDREFTSSVRGIPLGRRPPSSGHA